MPTLTWRGKDAVLNHHLEVPYRLLKCEPELSAGAPGQGNLIVEGDNLQALKALLPYYKGQVKCIYIDPPYNTGNEGWIYNDNVNSPEIKQWLGQVVGKEAEDLNRHDKWLCMMWPRLKLLYGFLHEEGVIAISLDGTEYPVLRLTMDDIFGRKNHLGTFCWRTRNTDNRVVSRLSVDHEYVLVYSKGGPIRGRKIDRSDFKNPDSDPRGPYVTDPLTGKATAKDRPNLHYEMQNPITGDIFPPDPSRGWITDNAGYQALLASNSIWWPASAETGKPRKKRFLSETEERMPVSSFWSDTKKQTGADEVDQILGERLFQFPKSVDFMSRVLDLIAGPDDLVLDSFAGSGTTAHAVLKLNAEDGGDRKFILVEMDPAIARPVTAERVRRVAQGYTNAKQEAVPGLGGGFRYCTLGAPLFDGEGPLSGDLSFEALAHHLYFMEFGEPLPRPFVPSGTFIGSFGDRALHLLFTPGKPSLLDRAALKALPSYKGERVVFADGCTVPDSALAAAGVRFRQIPYDVRG